MRVKLANGYVVAEQPSLLTGEPIVAILTGVTVPSSNPKTGAIPQLWVFPTHDYPSQTLNVKGTHAGCGDCPLRDGVCYVNMAGVNQVYKAYKKGNYPLIDKFILGLLKYLQKPLRLTAYGEAPAFDYSILKPLIQSVPLTLGYTHLWKTCDPIWSQHLMASCETFEQAFLAQSMGWKTYRITQSETDPLDKTEMFCPNFTNQFITCERCQRCEGNKTANNIVIPVHGRSYKQNNFINLGTK